MLAVERLQYIMEVLKEKKVVMVSDISKEVSVSEETVRRDLEKLEKKGEISRVHGGAYLKEGFGNETSVAVREKIYRQEKEMIAAACAELIEEQDTVMLDCSTTASYLAEQIAVSQKKLSVVTNSLSVAQRLSTAKDVRMILLGGELNRRTNSFVGDLTIRDLDYYFADKVFLSSAGISSEAGISDYTQDEAAIRRKMLERSAICICAVDDTKIGRTALHTIAGLKAVNYLVTNEDFVKKDLQLRNELDRLRAKIVIC